MLRTLLRILTTLLIAAFAMPAIAGNFFPPEYKTFPFKEGDLLSSQRQDGRFAVSKVLKVDRIIVKKGASINIQGKTFIAPEEDFLLVISCAYGESEFTSLEAARAAAKAGTWHIAMEHVPNRAPGAQHGQVLVGHMPVRDSELTGYRQWRVAFDRGEAGVF